MAKKYRSFTGVLYPDSTSYDCAEKLEMLEGVFEEWGYVLHDKDTNADGTPKKPHYHWVGHRKNGVMVSTIAKALGLNENEVEYGKSGWRSLVRYLTHIDHPEKAAYTVDLITANFDVSRFMVDEMTGDEVAKSIFSYVMSGKCQTATQLVGWCIDNGYWSELRRSFGLWQTLMNEVKANVDEKGLSALRG